MRRASKYLIAVGCAFILAAAILKGMVLSNPTMALMAKPSSLLILANTSFILAILLKK